MRKLVGEEAPLRHRPEAEIAVAVLRANEVEGWSYRLEDTDRSEWVRVACYDDEGTFVGHI